MNDNILAYEEFKIYTKYLKNAQTSEELDKKMEELKNDKTIDESMFSSIGYIIRKLKDAFDKKVNKKKKK